MVFLESLSPLHIISLPWSFWGTLGSQPRKMRLEVVACFSDQKPNLESTTVPRQQGVQSMQALVWLPVCPSDWLLSFPSFCLLLFETVLLCRPGTRFCFSSQMLGSHTCWDSVLIPLTSLPLAWLATIFRAQDRSAGLAGIPAALRA